MPENAADGRNHFTNTAMDAAIRIGVVALLIGLCFQIVRPFLVPLLWGVIIAVAVHPVFTLLVGWLGGLRRAAAIVLTVLMLALLVAPSVFLSTLLVDNVETLATELREGRLVVPSPPPEVATWPVIGSRLSALWQTASVNLSAALEQLAPQLRVVGGWLLSNAAGVGIGILQFVAAVAIAGVLLPSAERGSRVLHDLAGRLGGEQGAKFVDLAGATVRSVAQGIVGVAVIQSSLAALGLVLAGVPVAGLWAFLCLICAVIQIGLGPVLIPANIYVFSTADGTTATVFLIWSILVGLLDNVLKPILLGRGVDVPMWVIFVGTIGGMLFLGIIGLFVGAVVLALGYRLFFEWLAVSTAVAVEEVVDVPSFPPDFVDDSPIPRDSSRGL